MFILNSSIYSQIDLIKDIYPGDRDSNINFLETYKNEIYFTAVPTSFFSLLHKYDGNTVTEIKDANGNSIQSPTNFTIKDDIAYFSGTINNVSGGFSFNGTTFTKFVDNYFYNPIIYKDKIYFYSSEGGFGSKFHLWVTDGTESGTSKFKEIEVFKSFKSHIWENVVTNNLLFFVAETPENGIELWKTDGTENGTALVKDIYTGDQDSDPDDFYVASNGLLYFTAKNETEGRELWVTDGTESGTLMLKDFYPGTTGGDFYLTELNDKVYIIKEDRLDFIYETDGTPENTKPLENDIKGRRFMFTNEGTIYFSGSKSGESGDLFITDGTIDGSRVLKSGLDCNRNVPMKLFKNEIYFNGEFGSQGEELWKTDGTENGTVLVKDIGSGTIKDGFVNNLHVVGDELIFQAYQHAVTGRELWKTDGTESGTILIADVNSGRYDFGISKFQQYNNSLLMSAEASADIGKELYKYENSATASNDDFNIDDVIVYYANNALKIKNFETKKSNLLIYNVLGKKIFNIFFTSNGNGSITIHLKKGIYLIHINGISGKIVKKKILVK